MPVTLSVPISPWYIGQTLPVPTAFFTDDSGAAINLSGATLALVIRPMSGGSDTNGAGTFSVVGTLATLTGSTINSGAMVTSLPCSASTSVALPPHATVVCSSGGNAETFTYSGTVPLAVGAVSIPVVAQIAGHTHTAGDSITGLGLETYTWASGDVATQGNYLLYFKITPSGGGLYVMDPLSWSINTF